MYASDYSLSLRPSTSKMHVQNMAGVVAGSGKGIRMMEGLEIPVAPGHYDVNLVAQSQEDSEPVTCTLTVVRGVGKVSEVELKGPIAKKTQAKKEFLLSVSAST